MTGRPVIPLFGQVFDRLTVAAKLPSDGVEARWLCECSCGGYATPTGSQLRRGGVKSCGCLKRERAPENRTIHGRRYEPEYQTWVDMWRRCTNPKRPDYPLYGGRGVEVCREWASFESFFSDMGPRPAGHTIDRIDNDQGYHPGNCRWATPLQQRHNRRDSK